MTQKVQGVNEFNFTFLYFILYRTKMNPYNILTEEGHEGNFTSQFKARKSSLRHLTSLKEFADYILANPTEFKKITRQRANYYNNLIARRK